MLSAMLISSGWSPVYVEDNLGVMSIGFMLPNADDAVIWRGPKKNGLIKQVVAIYSCIFLNVSNIIWCCAVCPLPYSS